ncbi:MAG: hypothetical protein HY078_03210 [Elusimicrobia bacterium]|nr:hypothetical protein [Elusimicrobiota bacterium]
MHVRQIVFIGVSLTVLAVATRNQAGAESPLEGLINTAAGGSVSVPAVPQHTTPYDAAKDATDEKLREITHKKATCPFLGAAVALKQLVVRNSADKPLAGIDEVVALGNSGGGDLGEVLRVFAQGNHAFMPGAAAALDQPVPAGLFSLDLPGSQGSHYGHSGILQGNPKALGTGRFSQSDFDRLLRRAKNGYVTRSQVGRFIAENIARDPNSKAFSGPAARDLAADLHNFVGAVGPRLAEKIRSRARGASESEEERKLFIALTKATGEDNLIGSAGEFGLLFAFLVNKPGARRIGLEPALATADLTAMFKDKKFPAGWERWPKTKHDWVVNTTGLLLSAGREYLKIRR